MTSQAMHIHHQPRIIDARHAFDDRNGQYRFGRYVARPASRDLMCDGEQICIGSRAFDLLIVLLRSPGEIVTKEDIFRHVWPSTTVDESNLRFQMASLRKALGSERERIKTIPGRGYLFTIEEEQSVQTGIRPVPVRDGQMPTRSAIVIIDPDPENREALKRLLRPFHALVQSFGSFEAFLESGVLED